MAYKMTLNLGGKKYDVLSTSFSFNRSVDPKGRPSSG
ncbi:MAG: type VI secretion system needle protein Hcp, partial [Bacteroidetes bacterium]|nr:type VI secretion system needle protein Hcp [Bacteroidota bacterium]